MKKIAIIIGAGPAGLTAAYELVHRTDIQPIILEKSDDIGGICKTVNYRGNRLDIGGHRFFSKSDRVMKWWLNILPLEEQPDSIVNLRYQQQSQLFDTSHYPKNSTQLNDKVMLLRSRQSRIFYLKKFFHYPISFSLDTARKLGIVKLFKVGISFIKAKIWPRKEKNLEDFFINRFGIELYTTFFKEYTEKVWGVACASISAEWGAQRVKELSVGKALMHSIKKILPLKEDDRITQKDKETSLIEYFLYPKYGPGQLWEEVARIIEEKGGKIFFGRDVSKIFHDNSEITKIEVFNKPLGTIEIFEGDYFFSSMSIREFVVGMFPTLPDKIVKVAMGLQYRDLIIVGLLLRKLKINNNQVNGNNLIRDNWIYIQDHSVKLGRVQIYNNWSPFMVKDPDTVWLGLEYFCGKGDELWSMPDSQFIQFSVNELQEIGFIDAKDVLDSTIIRMEKAYPAYFGTYANFHIIKNYLNAFTNLFLVGRNGMHKYNNSDHSMLTSMTAVDNIIEKVSSKENIWNINTEQEYHEQ